MCQNPDDVLEMTQWDYFWVPNDVTITDRRELLYFSCPRDVPILNAVTRTRAEAQNLPELIGEVSRAHRNVRSRWLVRDLPSSVPLKTALAAAGYTPTVQTLASAIRVGEYAPRAVDNIVVRQVSDMTSLRDCAAVIGRAFPGGRAFTDEELARDLRNCTGENSRVHRFVAYDGRNNNPLSSGGMTLFPALGFGLLWAGGTIPEARGRGAYSAVLTARVTKARELDLDYVGLYAVVDTSAPIVLRHGFKTYGTMTLWERRAQMT
jgi:hypothetical protein